MLAVVLGIPFVHTAHAATVAERVSGRVVLQVQQHGEMWYINPRNLQRYYMSNPTDTQHVMSRLGLGITDANLAKIPIAGSTATGDLALRRRVSGYILLQVEQHGEAWYVYPGDQMRYSLGRPADAFAILHHLDMGISNPDIATIPIGQIILSPTSSPLQSMIRTVVTARGTFLVDQVSFNRTTANLKIMTDTGNTGTCATNCTALSLGTYVTRHTGGTAGIHGTYFCPPDYASCAASTNFYFYPVFNSFSKTMINADRIKYTTEPIMVFDTANKPYYFHHATSFVDVATFEAAQHVTLRSAISNGPALIEVGKNILDPSQLDTKQATVHSYRGAVAYTGDTIYFFVVHNATVTDAAAVLDTLGVDYAMNLDGGGSTALYNAGKYILGPGRNLPNAIVVTK